MPHALPDDPHAVAISWRTSGGLGAAGDDAGAADLEVLADGTARVGGRFAGGARSRRLEPARLQALLDTIVDRHRFFDFDPARVEAQVEAARPPASPADEAVATVPLGPPYADAGDTHLLVAADGRRHEVRWHGLFAAAREHPEIEPLQQLRAVERTLLELAEELAAGGG